MALPQLPKLESRVRFPSLALKKARFYGLFISFDFSAGQQRRVCHNCAREKPVIFKKRGRVWYFRRAGEPTFHSTGRTTEAARDIRKRPRNRLLLCSGPERLGIDVLRKQGGKLFCSSG
jgi:hypothetical protein